MAARRRAAHPRGSPFVSLPVRVFLADLIVVLHLGYVLFVILGLAAVWLGGWRQWRWVRRPGWRLAHLAAIGIVAVEGLCGVTCPLTTWEFELRQAAGQTPEQLGFLARMARDLLFVDCSEVQLVPWYVGFFLLVLGSLVLVPPVGWRPVRPSPTDSADSR
jgi:hypothetical protein